MDTLACLVGSWEGDVVVCEIDRIREQVDGEGRKGWRNCALRELRVFGGFIRRVVEWRIGAHMDNESERSKRVCSTGFACMVGH